MFLIRSLNSGGTERQLTALATALALRCPVVVVTFYPGGPFWQELTSRAVPVLSLAKRGRWDLLRFSWHLWRVLRTWRPTVLQTFLPEPNIFGAILGRLAGVPHVVWGLRSSNMAFEHYDGPLRWTFRAAAALSAWPRLTIVNSEAGRRHHVERGYAGPMTVIPNGIDTEVFQPARERGRALRETWDVSPDEVLIGVVARLDPMKGHRTFLEAAVLVAERLPFVRFACIGEGPDRFAADLRRCADASALGTRLIWAGRHQDVVAVYNALDIGCSASVYGEGFSNAIAEAMACAVPCVVTDVGDARTIVADTGRVAAPADAEALALEIEAVVNMSPGERRELGRAARSRIVQHFSLERMVGRTLQQYEELLSGGTPRAGA